MSETSLEQRCADAIDSSWFFSFYWERNKGHILTLTGWRRIKRDAHARIEGAYSIIQKIDLLMPEIDAEIAKLEAWELEDATSDTEAQG